MDSNFYTVGDLINHKSTGVGCTYWKQQISPQISQLYKLKAVILLAICTHAHPPTCLQPTSLYIYAGFSNNNQRKLPNAQLFYAYMPAMASQSQAGAFEWDLGVA